MLNDSNFELSSFTLVKYVPIFHLIFALDLVNNQLRVTFDKDSGDSHPYYDVQTCYQNLVFSLIIYSFEIALNDLLEHVSLWGYEDDFQATTILIAGSINLQYPFSFFCSFYDDH